MAIGIHNVTDMKKQPVEKGANIKERFGGFPAPMAKQMSQQPPRKLKFPKLRKGKK